MGGSHGKAIDIDFECDTGGAGAGDQALVTRARELLERVQGAVENVSTYAGCTEIIREALTDANKETECVKQVAIRVESMRAWMDMSKEMDSLVPDLLAACGRNPDSTANPALPNLLSLVLAEVLRFDEEKMKQPNVLNDLAYYRRVLGKAGRDQSWEPTVTMDEAGKCQMFLSVSSPMMVAVAAATKRAHAANPRVLGVLPMIANATCAAVVKHKYTSTETNVRCMRAMTAAIVLYDHVDTQGAFHKRSQINMRKCVTLLKTHSAPVPPPVLLDSLRFTTKHLNDDTTPAQIKKSLAQ